MPYATSTRSKRSPTNEPVTSARRLYDLRHAGNPFILYPVCGGSGYKQPKAKLHCIESDEVAVAFGPPA
jgi:hypothetical protein